MIYKKKKKNVERKGEIACNEIRTIKIYEKNVEKEGEIACNEIRNHKKL